MGMRAEQKVLSILVENSLFAARDIHSAFECSHETGMKSHQVDFRAFVDADRPVKPRSLAHITTAERRFTPIFA